MSQTDLLGNLVVSLIMEHGWGRAGPAQVSPPDWHSRIFELKEETGQVSGDSLDHVTPRWLPDKAPKRELKVTEYFYSTKAGFWS